MRDYGQKSRRSHYTEREKKEKNKNLFADLLPESHIKVSVAARQVF